MKFKIIFLGLLMSMGSLVNAQTWRQVDESTLRNDREQLIFPNEYVVASVADNDIKMKLWNAPAETGAERRSSETISVMLADGQIDEFRVVSYDMMEDELKRKFPELRTFHGYSTTDLRRRIRIDYTLNGFRAVISDENGKTYIDPFHRGDNTHRIIYRKSALEQTRDWECSTVAQTKDVVADPSQRFAGDCQLREYRIAVATTGEYSTFHGGNVPSVMSAITTSINRVNDVYEQDLTVRMNLVGNNDQLIFLDAGSDPYSNTNGSAMLTENQTTVDNIIGSTNYDIGHVFSTGGGGVAYLESLCNNSLKAGGVTGQNLPIGDPFDIDYVCHEIGHQFGGNHTQNNNCNRSSASVEPGSASTIMGYAGICAPNVQNNSDAYFHAISIGEMTAHITGAANACAMISASGNNAPTLDPLNNYTVPAETFLVLEASAEDADGNDVLSYCWEQMDPEVATMPPVSTNSQGPAFRSISPSASPKRYLPNLQSIIDSITPMWEVLPSVSRTMNWRVTVRDHFEVVGCTIEDDMIITVDGSSGPFKVYEGSIPATVQEGQNLTLKWNVAGTNLSPVNCANVDIFLSTDGGLTYPVAIASGTDNDGAESVVIPASLTTTARIMVKCSDNIFFDINNMDFEIAPGGDGFTMEVDPISDVVCSNESTVITINTFETGTYSTPVNLSVTGIPSGASSSFSTNPVVPGNSSLLTLSNFGTTTGPFTLDIVGSSGSIVRTKNFDLTIEAPASIPTLATPTNEATNLPLAPTLTWNSDPNANMYEYQLTTASNGGGTIVQTGTTANSSVQVANNLSPNTTYFWRVRAISGCGTTAYSSDFSFTTANIVDFCETFSANNLPLTISRGNANNPASTTASIPVILNKTIVDINVTDIAGVYSPMEDLAFVLESPSNTEVLLYDFLACGNVANFEMGFDDESSILTPDCPPIGSNIYKPEEQLNDFNGENSSGTWLLHIYNFGNSMNGSFNAAVIEVCYEELVTCNLNVTSTSASGSGSLLDAIACANAGDIITLDPIISNQSINLGTNSIIIEKDLTIQADPLDNITILYSGSTSALQVKAGKKLTLKGSQIAEN